MIRIAALVLALPLLMIVALVFLVPIFANLFGGLGVEIPIPPRVVVAVVRHPWALLPAALAVAGAIAALGWGVHRR